MFLPGNEGNLAYNNTYGIVISPGQANRYFNGDIGSIWVFNQSMATSDIEALKDNTVANF